MLNIQNISVSYEAKKIIHDLTLAVSSGEFMALLGPNGAGKSTLLHAISGQMQPDSGRIDFLGQDIYQHNLDYKKQIGFVHEIPFFYANLTTEEFVQFVGKIKSLPLSIEKASELLEKVNLADERHKLTSELSMGMRKKLAIAAALIGLPKIIFLDEALNGIDFESAFQIKSVLKTFVKNGSTVILSTHGLEVVEKLCDRFVILNDGKIVSDMTTEELNKEAVLDLESHLLNLMNKTQ